MVTRWFCLTKLDGLKSHRQLQLGAGISGEHFWFFDALKKSIGHLDRWYLRKY